MSMSKRSDLQLVDREEDEERKKCSWQWQRKLQPHDEARARSL